MKTGSARLAEIYARLGVLDKRVATVKDERAALIKERNELEAAGA